MATKIIETMKEGDGVTFPKTGDKVLVHYTGCLASNGRAFDSSRAKGHAFTFVVGCGKVIKGWDVVVPQLSKGQRVRVHIPFDEGYGPKGNPPAIPPGADLLFDIEVLSFNETLVQERMRYGRETEEMERAEAEAQAIARLKASQAPKRSAPASSSSDSDSSSSSESSDAKRRRKEKKKKKHKHKSEKKKKQKKKSEKKSKKHKKKHKRED